jgi:hypothetical protein
VTITPAGDIVAKAYFAPLSEVVTVTVEMVNGSGTVELYIDGEFVSSHTSSFSFRTISSWSVDLVVTSVNGTWTFSHWVIGDEWMPDMGVYDLRFSSDTAAAARFMNATNSRYVTVEGWLLQQTPSVIPDSVAWSYVDNGVTIVRTVSGWAPKDAEITFTAIAGPYQFLYWSVTDASGISSVMTVSLTDDITMRANFASPIDVVVLTIYISGRGMVEISITDGPTFIYSEPFMVSVYDQVSKTAFSSGKWVFSHWIVDGVEDPAHYRTPRSFMTHTDLYVVFVESTKNYGLYALVLTMLISSLMMFFVRFLFWPKKRKSKEKRLKAKLARKARKEKRKAKRKKRKARWN